MLNLYSNAIKFTDREGKILFHIERKLENDKHYLTISISDSGEGIKEEN